MKKYLIFLLLPILMGCQSSEQTKAEERLDTTFTGYKIINIEGCEYIYKRYDVFSGIPVLTHKGNCKNPIHKNNCNVK